ncbi:MAG: AAA family ATPase, partial [Desulfatirhabdiaceae bacterium]
MHSLQNLPVGISSFERIRKDNHVYVDKTRHIFKMVNEGAFYFLSRPRRFGKSLTVSTLRCLFEGRKDLFDGLWIAENGNWQWQPHPVILIDFNEISHDTPDHLKLSLSGHIARLAGINGIQLSSVLLKDQLKELIVALYRKTGASVVILMDEYDKPLIDHLGKGETALEIAKSNRNILKDVLGVLKGGDVSAVLKFVFITGISKFSRVSIFSELNNLEDITMVDAYADMLGYTQDELQRDFQPHIRQLADTLDISHDRVKTKLKQYYDGYRFSKRDIRVYNPFSVMSALKQKDFKNYWFETGTPTFLINILTEKNWYLPKIEDMSATEIVFSSYELENLKPEALLFQTGYVTIKCVTERLFTFDYPNQEVKTSFLEMLFHSHTEGLRDSSQFVRLSDYLYREDYDQFFKTMSAIFASIPYTLQTKRDEAYFHTVFYLMVCASGADAHSEVMTCDGRIDLLIEFPDKLFLIEFKCNQRAAAGIAQIREK